MAELPVRPSSLINTIYGAYVRRLGGWISIADLIMLMGELGVDAQAVRSAISRLKKRGTLVQERGKAIGYRLSPGMVPIFVEGDRRIFSMLEPAALEDGWVLAIFSVPEQERALRHQLRTHLTRLGFGNTAPGVWIAPARMLDDTRTTLRRLGVADYVHLFSAGYEAFADLKTAVATWWDFPALEDQYATFTSLYTPLTEQLQPHAVIDNTQAFRDYIPMLTRWRRLPYLDPGLPPELLPDNWHATEARRVFLHLQARLADPGFRHVQKLTGLLP